MFKMKHKDLTFLVDSLNGLVFRNCRQSNRFVASIIIITAQSSANYVLVAIEGSGS